MALQHDRPGRGARRPASPAARSSRRRAATPAPALAMIAAVRGYKCIFVMPDKMSAGEDRGACAPTARGSWSARRPSSPTTRAATTRWPSGSRTRRPTRSTPASITTSTTPAGTTASTGPELWEQTGGEIDVFVAGLGTGGTITGTGRYLKEKKPEVQLVGVDPVGSLYYDFVKTGRVTKPFTYKVEGIGEDFFPTTIDLEHPRRDRARRRQGVLPDDARSGAARGPLRRRVVRARRWPARSSTRGRRRRSRTSSCCFPTAPRSTCPRSSTTTGCARTASSRRRAGSASFATC